MLALIATGAGNVTCCQPEAVSPAKLALASSVPVLDQSLPTCVPVLAEPL